MRFSLLPFWMYYRVMENIFQSNEPLSGVVVWIAKQLILLVICFYFLGD